MKKFLFIFLMAFSGMVYAQDTIALANKQTILCKILEVSSSEIKYKKWSNPEGPIYTVAISNILSISYQNGEKEDLIALQFFTKESPIQNNQTVAAQNASIQSIQTNIDYLRRDELLRRSRGCRIGGIISSVCCGVGIMFTGCFLAGMRGASGGNISMIVIGGVGTISLATGLVCTANRLRREAYAIDVAHLYEKDFKMRNGKLSTGADLLVDKDHHKAIGVGIKYNF